MKASHLLTAAFAFSTFSTAWPWPPSIEDVKALYPVNNILQRRQDDNQNNADSATAPPKSTAQASETNSSSDSDSKTTDAPSSDSTSASQSGKKSGPNKSDKSSATKTSHVSIDPAAGAGGIALITPATTVAASQLYKVDSTITWVWNYTSLTSAPAAIDILATFTPEGAGAPAPSPYTLATNVSFDKTQSFVWDTGKYATSTSTLGVGTYTLLVYDAALPTYSATAAPGFLGLYNQFSFAMYTGQPRVDLTDPYVCATCNGATSLMEKTTLKFLFGMMGVTIATFTWFAGMWGLF